MTPPIVPERGVPLTAEDEAIRNAVFGDVDLSAAELEMEGSIYDGFAAAIMVKGQTRTVALTREYSDAVQLMAIIQRDRATLPMILGLHRAGVLSEGQVSTATGLDRVDIRQRVDALPVTTAPALSTAETVVVPVEPTEAMISALDASLHDHWPDARKMALGAWKSALAAAPAREPEGGAVLDALDEALTYIEKLGANIERNDIDMNLDTVERPFSFAQTMRSRFPSLCVPLAASSVSPAESEKLRTVLKRAGEYLSTISSSWGRSRQASVLPLMRDIREALTPKEAPAATGTGEEAETGWLIESDANGPLYQMAGRTTRNAVEALRFARQVDAEAYIAAHSPNHINSVLTPAWRAVEHRWG